MKTRISIKEFKKLSQKSILNNEQKQNISGSGLLGGSIDIDGILDKLPFGLGKIFKSFGS